jgi:hypothetical protein
MKPLCEINGVERNYPEGLINLEEMLRCMMEREVPKKELVLEVKVDGKTYSEAYENQAREVDLRAIEKVEITTQTMDAFARDSIREASAYLDPLVKGFGLSARLLRSPEQREKGYDILVSSIEVLQAFKSHMDQVNDLLRPGGEESEERIFWERFDQLADRLIRSLEEQEIEGVADLIEDELLPFLGTWQEKIAKRL